MSATLRPCSIGGGLASPSGLLLTSGRPRSGTLSLAQGLGGRSNLKLVSSTTRHGHGIVNGVADSRPAVVNREDPAEMEYELHEERDRIMEFRTKISDSDILLRCRETTGFRRCLCTKAEDSVKLVSLIMGKPDLTPQSALLTKLMTPTKKEKLVLQVHLRTFVSIAEAAYHDKVTKETIVSFLGALEGVAAMSYFMARDTLAKFSDDKSISPSFGPNIDVEGRRREYTMEMDRLKREFNTAPPHNAMKILQGTMNPAIVHTEFFVAAMTVCRRKVFRGLVQEKVFYGKPGVTDRLGRHTALLGLLLLQEGGYGPRPVGRTSEKLT